MASRISHLSPNRVSLYCPGYCGGPLPLTFSYIFETATQTRAAPAAARGAGARRGRARPQGAGARDGARAGRGPWAVGAARGREVLGAARGRPRALCALCGVTLSLSRNFHCDVMCKIYIVPTRRYSTAPSQAGGAACGRLAYSPASNEYSPCLGQEARTPGVWCLVNAEMCRDHAEQRQQHPMRSQAV